MIMHAKPPTIAKVNEALIAWLISATFLWVNGSTTTFVSAKTQMAMITVKVRLMTGNVYRTFSRGCVCCRCAGGGRPEHLRNSELELLVFTAGRGTDVLDGEIGAT